MEQNHIEHRPIEFKGDNYKQDRNEWKAKPTAINVSTPANDTHHAGDARPTPSPPRTALVWFSRSLVSSKKVSIIDNFCSLFAEMYCLFCHVSNRSVVNEYK